MAEATQTKTTIAIDPVTRIEGHLKAEVVVENIYDKRSLTNFVKVITFHSFYLPNNIRVFVNNYSRPLP